MSHEAYDHRINRAISLIDRRIEQDLSLQRLADEACISPFHFHRIFSALTGESVHAMTTRMRMERALALTRRGQRPQWKAVAVAVGYRSPDVFSRAFKRHFGCTPAQFNLERWWSERPDRDAAMSLSRSPATPDFIASRCSFRCGDFLTKSALSAAVRSPPATSRFTAMATSS